MSLASNIIDQVISNASSLKERAVSAADQALSAGGTVFYGVPFIDFQPEFKEPNISDKYFTDDFRGKFDPTYRKIFDDLKRLVPDQMNLFLNTFMPFDEEAWDMVSGNLKNAIEFGGVILPEEVEQQIIEKAKSKVNLELERTLDSINNSNGAKGFSIPPLALQTQLNMARLNSARMMSDVLGQVQVDQQKLRYEYVKFAIDRILEMKKERLANAFNYIQSIMGTSRDALNYANSTVDNYVKFADNNSKLINALMDIERTKIDIKKTEFQGKITSQQTNSNMLIQGAKIRSDSAVSVANTIAQSAAAALSGLNAIGSDVSLENI